MILLVHHRARWLENRVFLSQLPDERADWMVTAAFYVSVHAVGTLLAKDGAGTAMTHSERFAILKRSNRYRKV